MIEKSCFDASEASNRWKNKLQIFPDFFFHLLKWLFENLGRECCQNTRLTELGLIIHFLKCTFQIMLIKK